MVLFVGMETAQPPSAPSSFFVGLKSSTQECRDADGPVARPDAEGDEAVLKAGWMQLKAGRSLSNLSGPR